MKFLQFRQQLSVFVRRNPLYENQNVYHIGALNVGGAHPLGTGRPCLISRLVSLWFMIRNPENATLHWDRHEGLKYIHP
jgi:hypothetical protein